MTDGYVYFVGSTNGLTKIGYTTGDMASRFSMLQGGSPVSLYLDFSFLTTQPKRMEGIIHKAWGDYRVRGEWFALPRGTIERLPALLDRLDSMANERKQDE